MIQVAPYLFPDVSIRFQSQLSVFQDHQHANMKHRIFTCLLLGCLPLLAQQEAIVLEETNQIPLEESAAESSAASRAAPLIIGPLAGEPRPAPTRPAIPPPPRLNIPPQNTLTSKTHDFGDHTVTIEEVIPVALPPRPVPPAPRTAAQQQAFLQSRPARSKMETVNFSTTVYDRRATVIDWRSKDNTQSFRVDDFAFYPLQPSLSKACDPRSSALAGNESHLCGRKRRTRPGRS